MHVDPLLGAGGDIHDDLLGSDSCFARRIYACGGGEHPTTTNVGHGSCLMCVGLYGRHHHTTI